jgi:hypothetical protein
MFTRYIRSVIYIFLSFIPASLKLYCFITFYKFLSFFFFKYPNGEEGSPYVRNYTVINVVILCTYTLPTQPRHTHIYVFICIYIHIYVYMCVYIYIYMHAHICAHQWRFVSKMQYQTSSVYTVSSS